MVVNTEFVALRMNSPVDRMEPEGRVARRQRKNREALIKAARQVMAEKGIDAATMLEIAELADVGAGTVYNYFKSKDELAIVVLEEMMHDLALRIETLTAAVDDPAEVYAYGIRTVLDTATTDLNWRQMLYRSEVIADALFRRMGPFAIRDLRRAVNAGRFSAPDPELVWHLTSHAIVGVSLAITTDRMSPDIKDEVVIRLLCMTGLGAQAAAELAARRRSG
ncbi:TetR/AcrR family transcriptional regulator [Burkholderia multivorans]|uniref:TetR/AcrR family transcriptional regulator n=1 Tax=Burkholderia multivorans TaxID=87883 RepID=UPI001C12BFA0|nr:TetR/AcrR family transcriptional regulator [Burkholderia multivorans]MCA8456828.1 TetR/AcrR family transcriptional regulator [Burkholderia multivorans]